MVKKNRRSRADTWKEIIDKGEKKNTDMGLYVVVSLVTCYCHLLTERESECLLVTERERRAMFFEHFN